MADEDVSSRSKEGRTSNVRLFVIGYIWRTSGQHHKCSQNQETACDVQACHGLSIQLAVVSFVGLAMALRPFASDDACRECVHKKGSQEILDALRSHTASAMCVG